MIYLRADENDAGVTVESIDPAHYRDAAREELTVRFTVLGKDGEKPFVKAAALLTDPEARAVVEGLLRRMLERDGDDAAYDFVNAVTRKWLKESGR